MKTIRVTVSNYASPYFPLNARWKLNGVAYNDVFENMEQIKAYFSRFYPIEIKYIDLTNKEGK